jgi:hypothetical protein
MWNGETDMREEKRTMAVEATIYICDDGTEFAPTIEGMEPGNLKWRQDDAKSRAARHQSQVERRAKLTPMLERLFGARADEVKAAMDVPAMQCLERRWRVLETLDNQLESRKQAS